MAVAANEAKLCKLLCRLSRRVGKDMLPLLCEVLWELLCSQAA